MILSSAQACIARDVLLAANDCKLIEVKRVRLEWSDCFIDTTAKGGIYVKTKSEVTRVKIKEFYPGRFEFFHAYGV